MLHGQIEIRFLYTRRLPNKVSFTSSVNPEWCRMCSFFLSSDRGEAASHPAGQGAASVRVLGISTVVVNEVTRAQERIPDLPGNLVTDNRKVLLRDQSSWELLWQQFTDCCIDGHSRERLGGIGSGKTVAKVSWGCTATQLNVT